MYKARNVIPRNCNRALAGRSGRCMWTYATRANLSCNYLLAKIGYGTAMAPRDSSDAMAKFMPWAIS